MGLGALDSDRAAFPDPALRVGIFKTLDQIHLDVYVIQEELEKTNRILLAIADMLDEERKAKAAGTIALSGWDSAEDFARDVAQMAADAAIKGMERP